MNDNFLYTRQESPAPEFVTELREKLHQLEEPQKAKRKNGQRRFNWKALAAVISLVLVGITLWNTPEINIPVNQMIFGYPNADALQDAQEIMGIEIPDTPNGYYLFSAQRQTEFDYPPLLVHWQSYRGFCVIDLFAFAEPGMLEDEAFQQNQEYNRQLAESFSWADIVELGNDVEAIWRATTYNGQPLGVSLEWYFGGNMYNLSSTEECATKEVLAAMAQSTLPDNP
jgi:hypothetical protein